MKARFFNLAKEQHEVDYFSQPAYKRNKAQLGFGYIIPKQGMVKKREKEMLSGL